MHCTLYATVDHHHQISFGCFLQSTQKLREYLISTAIFPCTMFAHLPRYSPGPTGTWYECCWHGIEKECWPWTKKRKLHWVVLWRCFRVISLHSQHHSRSSWNSLARITEQGTWESSGTSWTASIAAPWIHSLATFGKSWTGRRDACSCCALPVSTTTTTTYPVQTHKRSCLGRWKKSTLWCTIAMCGAKSCCTFNLTCQKLSVVKYLIFTHTHTYTMYIHNYTSRIWIVARKT